MNTLGFIRTLILLQGILFLCFATAWAINDNLDKWFTRWALGIIMLAAWGIMKHLSKQTSE